MTDPLFGKIALITGASRGIGKSIAQRLHRDGATILLVARPSQDLEAMLAEFPERCSAWQGDIRSEEFLAWIDQLERIDILVNNVGLNIPKLMSEVSDEDLDVMLELNVRTPYRVSRHAISKMPEDSRVINISSQMGHIGSPKRTVYCMTKHAIEGLTKAMAVELAPRGIRVTSVAPTFVETPLGKKMLADPKFAEYVMDMIPLGKIAQPEDIATAVAFLAGPGGHMMTGTSLIIDGGWTAR